MTFLHENPFLRITIPFIIGIFLYEILNLPILAVLVIFSFSLFVLIFRLIYSDFSTYTTRWLDTVIVCILFMFFGLLNVWFHNLVENTTKNLNIETGKKYIITATLTSNVAQTKNAFKAIISTDAFNVDNSFIPHKEKILLYLPKDSIVQSMQYGSKIIFQARLQEVPDKSHPFAFDYKKYLLRLGIRFTCYAQVHDIKILGLSNRHKINSLANQLQHKILSILQSQLPDPLMFGVAAALVTGYRDALEIDNREMFANAGAMHIMCVSGLHVGILYLFLSYLLKLLPINKKTRLFRYVDVLSSLSIIWLFAFITGLAPSVTRASIMFSFIAIGNVSEHKMPIFNSIAASAFIILLFNPNALYSIGFQLSYLAVIGIITIYPILKQWFYVNNRFLRYIIDILLVSIAAQIFATPISLYYFHQFPNYFLLTNLIAIPLATAIMVTAIPLLFIHSIPYVGYLLQFLLTYELKILTFSVDIIQSLPGAVIQNIYISELQVILLYGAIVFFSIYTIRRIFYQFAMAMSCLIIFFSISSIRSIQSLYHQELIIPNLKQVWFIACSDKMCYAAVPEKNVQIQKLVTRQMKTYCARYNIKQLHFIFPDNIVQGRSFLFLYPFVYFHNYQLLFCTPHDTTFPVKPDYILITALSKRHTLNLIVRKYPEVIYVATADTRHNINEYLKKLANTYSARIHLVKEHGALSIKKKPPVKAAPDS